LRVTPLAQEVVGGVANGRNHWKSGRGQRPGTFAGKAKPQPLAGETVSGAALLAELGFLALLNRYLFLQAACCLTH